MEKLHNIIRIDNIGFKKTNVVGSGIGHHGSVRRVELSPTEPVLDPAERILMKISQGDLGVAQKAV